MSENGIFLTHLSNVFIRLVAKTFVETFSYLLITYWNTMKSMKFVSFLRWSLAKVDICFQ